MYNEIDVQFQVPVVSHGATITTPDADAILQVKVMMEGTPINGRNELESPTRSVGGNTQFPQVVVLLPMLPRNSERVTWQISCNTVGKIFSTKHSSQCIPLSGHTEICNTHLFWTAIHIEPTPEKVSSLHV